MTKAGLTSKKAASDMHKMVKNLTMLLAMVCCAFSVHALPEIKVGVLKFGTANWEIDVIKHHQLDKKYQFDLTILPLGSKNASAVALQSKAVDVILSDWLWVNRQRFNDKNYTLFPTSRATGGLYVSTQLPIKSVLSLKDRKIGVAGGAVDKNWLLLQAYSQKKYGFDIKQQSLPTFATPPLLNQLMLRGDLAAAINFWHYGARLKAAGFQLLVTVPEILAELGVESQLPLLGWVFDQQWAAENSLRLSGFLRASLEAKQILYSSDDEWKRIRSLTKAENDGVFNALKVNYRAGLLREFGEKEINASQQIFAVLAQQGGKQIVGKATSVDQGTFYQKEDLKITLLTENIE